MVPERLGRYEILGELGRGSMGVVYRAHDPMIDRPVAIKTIPVSPGMEDPEPKRSGKLVERLRREALIAGKLSHPHIVTIYDVGEQDSIFFMAMEFLEGYPMSDLIKDCAPLNATDVTGYLEKSAGALDYAHAKGVVHRDIKPSNIMLDKTGGLVITDFGIAKYALSTITADGHVVGSPSYMSPEQVRGEELDGRSDIFSLGIVVYMLLTGNKPFVATDFHSIAYQIVHTQPEALDKHNREVPRSVSEVVMWALSKKRDQRPGSATEFYNAFIDAMKRGSPQRLGPPRYEKGQATETQAAHKSRAQSGERAPAARPRAQSAPPAATKQEAPPPAPQAPSLSWSPANTLGASSGSGAGSSGERSSGGRKVPLGPPALRQHLVRTGQLQIFDDTPETAPAGAPQASRDAGGARIPLGPKSAQPYAPPGKAGQAARRRLGPDDSQTAPSATPPGHAARSQPGAREGRGAPSDARGEDSGEDSSSTGSPVDQLFYSATAERKGFVLKKQGSRRRKNRFTGKGGRK